MKTFTLTTTSTTHIQTSSTPTKPGTPAPFNDCLQSREHSSQPKVKHPQQFGVLIDLCRQQKRYVSLHKLQVKSPMNHSKDKESGGNPASVREQSDASPAKSICPSSSVSRMPSVSGTRLNNEIEEMQEYRKWIKRRGQISLKANKQNILCRMNGGLKDQTRKVKISVKNICKQKPK